MIQWKFEIDKQKAEYDQVKNKVMAGDYDELRFYVLPTLPQMFRNRVVFLPRKFDPEKIYQKQKHRLQIVEQDWQRKIDWFEAELKKNFPRRDEVEIVVSPSLFGPLGTFEVEGKKIIVKPRYDRNVIATQRLVINALTNYFFLTDKQYSWEEKQELISEYQHKIFWKNLTMKRVIQNSLSAKLALESIEYKKELGCYREYKILPIEKLTKNEAKVFELLSGNRRKLTGFDEIAEVLWHENSDFRYSEYAITKLMERLKKKLPKYCLHSQRGRGYLLV